MRLTVVATGSHANCYLLSDSTESLLLDAGVPIRRLLPFLPDLRTVAGCLVTHEHGDHVRGAAALAARGIPVYCSAGTAQAVAACIGDALPAFHPVPPLQQFTLGGFTVLPFPTQHDAAEPFGFLIRSERTRETLLYATDTYYLRYTFPAVSYWLVECNYCDDLITPENSNFDLNLRGRLLESHMSLRHLREALAANDLSETARIVLVHLSDTRSDETRMTREIAQQTGIDTMAASNGMSIDLSLTPF